MKYCLSFLLFFGLATAVFSQVSSISSIYLGGNGQVGLSLIAEQNNYGKQEMEFLPTVAYSGGITFNINWYENLGLQIEGNYSVQGQDYEGVQSNKLVKKVVRLNYVQIPIMFKYTFTDYTMNQNAPNLYALGGIQFGALQGASLSYTTDGTPQTFDEYHESNPLVNRLPDYVDDLSLFHGLDVGLVGAVGAEFAFSDVLTLMADGRLNFGLSDINARDWRFPDLRNQYTASRNFSLGFRIALVATIY